MSTNTSPLSNNPLIPLQRVSLNSLTTNILFDSDVGNSSLVMRTGTINSLYIDKYANVGINTTAPTAQLEVASSNGACLRLRYGTSATAYSDVFTASNGNLSIRSNSGVVSIASDVTTTGNITIGGTLTITGGGSINAVLTVVDPNAIGYAEAGKALIVDNSLNITGINAIGVASIHMGTSTISTADAGYISNLSSGTATASKALILNSSSNISGINALSASQLTGTLQTAAQPNITSVGTLTSATISGATNITSTADATSISSGGALTVSGGLAVFKNTYIGGNLYVQGTTTSVSSTVVTINDNTLLLNASPIGPYDSGILVQRYQTVNDTNIGSVITDTPTFSTTVSSATTSNVILSAGSVVDNFYKGWWININNQSRQVSSYVGSTKTITVSSNFTTTPVNGNAVNLYSQTLAGVIWSETNKQFETIYTPFDNTIVTVSNNAPLRTGIFTADSITSNGLITFTNTTEATSTITASVVLSGGIGIAKALYVGNGIYGVIQTSAQPNITSIGTLSSALSVSFANNTSSQIAYQTWTNSSTIPVVSALTQSNAGSQIGTSTNHRFVLMTNSIGHMIISSGGRTAIGSTVTEQTTYDLDVQGTLNSVSLYIGGTQIVDSSRNLSVNALTSATTLTIGASSVNSTKLGYLDTTSVGTVAANKVIIADSNKTISGLASLSLSNTSPSGVVYESFVSDTYTFTEGVQGSSTTISANSYYWNYNGNYCLFMNPSGNVAVGFNVVVGTMFNYKLNVNGSINATNYYWNGSLLNLGYIQTPTPGTASASSALIVDASKNISGINSISTTSITVGSNVLNSTNTGYITGLTAGTATQSKALVTDSNNSISGINALYASALYVNNAAVLTSASASFAYLTNATVGTALANTVMIVDSNIEIANVHAIKFADASTTGVSRITFTSDSYTMDLGLRGSANTSGNNIAYLAFNGADRIIMNTSGNIGIGTSSVSTYKTNINGTINTTGYYLNGTQLSLGNIDIINGVVNGVASANKVMTLDGSLNITGINSMSTTSITVGSNALTSTNTGYLMITTPGIAEASKALVLNSSSQISGISSISTTSLTLNGNIISTEAAFISGAQKGTATAGKVLVSDNSNNITGLGSLSLSGLTLAGTAITSTMVGYLTNLTAGTASAGQALVTSSPDNNISGLGTVGCSTLILGGNTLTASQFTYVNNLVPGIITPNKAVVIGPNSNVTFGTTSMVFDNNMVNVQLSNTSPTNYAIVQRWTNSLSPSPDMMTDISFSSYACRFGTYSNHALRLITNNSTKMYFDTLGNIGVGNNNPAYMMDISGTTRVNQLLVAASTDTSMQISALTGGNAQIALGATNTAMNQAELHFNYVSSGSTSNNFTIGFNGASYSNIITITGTKYVGINNTSPNYALDVTGDINFSGALRSGGTSLMNSSGILQTAAQTNITSVGTLSSLTVNGTLTNTSTTDSTSTSTGSVLISGGVGIAKALSIGGDLNAYHKIGFIGTSGDTGTYNYTVIAERIYGGVEQSELVLFKGNDPTAPTGPDRIRMRSASFTFQTYLSAETYDIMSDNNDRLIITNTGFVGISNTSPNYSLDVTGDINFSGALRSGGTSLMNSSGTLQTAAQTNITSVGTLSSLTVSGTLTNTNTTDSTSISTGSVLISGGVGIAKALSIGGDFNANHKIGFIGTTGDTGSYNFTVIAERIYAGVEDSEMVLFKGNDPADRIRMRAGAFTFQTYSSVETYDTSSDNNDRLSITNAGFVGIATKNPVAPLHIALSNGSISSSSYAYYSYTPGSPGSVNTGVFTAALTDLSMFATGRIYAAQYAASSDRRIKQDITSLTDEYCDRLLKVDPCIYKKKTTQGMELGFIAQDLLREHITEVITMTKSLDEGGYLIEDIDDHGVISHEGIEYGISYTSLIPILLNLVKRNREKNDKLQSEIDSLKEIVASMQAKLDQ